MIELTINGLPFSVDPREHAPRGRDFPGLPDPHPLPHGGPVALRRVPPVRRRGRGGEGREAGLRRAHTSRRRACGSGTASTRVVRARRMIIELLLASCPQSKVIQDLASAHGVNQQRFRQEHDDCILCGRCARVCKEQMMAGAIGFHGRGEHRALGAPFDKTSEVCRHGRSLHLRLPGVPAPLHLLLYPGQGRLRRLPEPQAALPASARLPRHDVLHVAMCRM